MKISEIIVEADQSRRKFLNALAGGATLGAAGGASELLSRYQSTPSKTVTRPAPPVFSPEQLKQRKEVQDRENSQKAKIQAEINDAANPSLAEKRANLLLYKAYSAGLRGTELAQFMAQCDAETDGFKRMTPYARKEWFLSQPPFKSVGNTSSEQNWEWRPRGYIQLQGIDNYIKMATELQMPELTVNPNIAYVPEVAAKIALQYWFSVVKPKLKPNIRIDKTTGFPPTRQSKKDEVVMSSNFPTPATTKLVNGRLELLDKRQEAFRKWIPLVSSFQNYMNTNKERLTERKKKSRSQKRRASRRVYGTIFGYSGDGNFDGGGGEGA